ncbi:MAG: DUF202 domain-containing protein [Alphaproteobacteria bacterium]|nr:DUF202 domain-containing protein [Alphaproteobacteria bacterium]
MPEDDTLILRDVLALDRTSLANERTLLAYVRTAVGLIAGGIGLTQLMPDTWAMIVGGLSTIVGTATLVIGIWRFVAIQSHIRRETATVPPK